MEEPPDDPSQNLPPEGEGLDATIERVAGSARDHAWHIGKTAGAGVGKFIGTNVSDAGAAVVGNALAGALAPNASSLGHNALAAGLSAPVGVAGRAAVGLATAGTTAGATAVAAPLAASVFAAQETQTLLENAMLGAGADRHVAAVTSGGASGAVGAGTFVGADALLAGEMGSALGPAGAIAGVAVGAAVGATVAAVTTARPAIDAAIDQFDYNYQKSDLQWMHDHPIDNAKAKELIDRQLHPAPHSVFGNTNYSTRQWWEYYYNRKMTDAQRSQALAQQNAYEQAVASHHRGAPYWSQYEEAYVNRFHHEPILTKDYDHESTLKLIQRNAGWTPSSWGI